MPLVVRRKFSLREHYKLLLVLLIFILGLVFLWWFLQKPLINRVSIVEEVSTPEVVEIQSRNLFFGTTFWGRYINQWSMQSILKWAYPFSGLHELGREKYDAWLANLECPTVPGLSLTPEQEEATLAFNCPPEYLSEASKWFTVFGSANNHSDNQGGDEGLRTTRKQLEKHGIQYFGHFDPEKLQDVCEVVSLPARAKYDNGKETKVGMPVALCGYHGVFKIPSAESLAVMKEYSKYMPVVAYPHAGAEYKATPDEIKTNLYRAMIDNGADMVLGDHPHWVQNAESYKGKLIVYSMGNFIFDQQSSSEVTRSASIEVLFKAIKGERGDLEDWTSLAKDCEIFQDNCLAIAQKQGLKRPAYTFGFNFVATDNAGKLTKLASPTQRGSIKTRLNWDDTMNKLQAPSYAL